MSLSQTSNGTLPPFVFLFDVDNTLLDNDRFLADFRAQIETDFGPRESERYWQLIETHRQTEGYVDYLAAIQQFRKGLEGNVRLLDLARFVTEYPFADRLFPGALDLLNQLRTKGRTVIFSDGDIVLQPRKIRRSGLWDAVDGNVLIQIHKQLELGAMLAAYPAHHYVMVDDKIDILLSMKATMGSRLTTVFVQQGHYAAQASRGSHAAADITIAKIADLCSHVESTFGS